MKHASPLLSSLPLTLFATACGAVDAAPAASPPPTPANVGLAIAADRDAAAIATLRARGRAALDELLATYDRMAPGPRRTALAATIDAVAAQRYATQSRLFWHTDLAAALAEARATGKPVLSLKMLGRLDEDLSCANSRMFRTILYPDPAVSALLRDRFVLHWSSERAVPRVTIDFGDGRKLERTITGNSIHYVLDHAGRPIDALPGLYAPKVFRDELARSLALHLALAGLPEPSRAHALREHHHGRITERNQQWLALGSVDTGRSMGGDLELVGAQRRTMGKAMVELPELSRLDLGPDPRLVLPDVDVWAQIGVRVFGFSDGAGGFYRADGSQPIMVQARGYRTDLDRARQPLVVRDVLSAPARDLVARVVTGGQPLDADRLAFVIARLEQTLVADTAINELQLRLPIRAMLADAPPLDKLNRAIYDTVFLTPASDPWLGLLPRDVYTGLPGDGVVTPTTRKATFAAR